MKEILNEHRCSCGKMLFRGLILSGDVEIKCRFCKKLHTITGLGGSLSNPHAYVLVLDVEGQIVKTTASARTILGYTDDELLRMRIYDLIVMLNPTFYASLWKTLDELGHTVVLLQTLHRQKDKSMAAIHIEARAFSSPGGRHLLFAIEKRKAHHNPVSVEEMAAESILK